MSHDELKVVPQVSVTRAEYEKFCYLVKTLDAVDRAHDVCKEKLRDLRSSEGAQGYMDFDWRLVTQQVAPQLQLVFLSDRERDPYTQLFMRFPVAVIVVRTAFLVDLDSEFELDLEGSDAHQDVNSATNALRTLESVVMSLTGRRQVDADRTLRQLSRALRIEL